VNKPEKTYSDYYSDEFIDDICRSFDISENKKSKLIFFLNNAAPGYLYYKTAFENAPGSRELRKEIRKIGEWVENLLKLIDETDKRALDILWNEIRAPGETPRKPAANSETDQFFAKFGTGNGPGSDALFGGSEIQSALHRLKLSAARANERLKAGSKGGRPRIEAARIWVSNARDFWTHALGRKFSFDMASGEMATDAGNFCLQALKALDPDVTASMVATAMRAAIRKNL